LSNKNEVTVITNPTSFMSCLNAGSAITGNEKRKKCWWCHSTKHQMGNVDLCDKLTGLYFIWSQSSTWFWPLFRFANLWVLCECVDWRVSLLLFASQTVSFPARVNVGAKWDVRPQTNKGFLYVVRSNEYSKVDKNAEILKDCLVHEANATTVTPYGIN